MSAERFLYSTRECLYTFIVHKVYRFLCTHSLGELETLLVAIYSYDVLNTHCTEYCDTDQTDRSASLYNNSAVETKDSCCFCSLYCMYKHCTWLNEDSGIQIQITYIEECSSEVSAS